MNWDRGLFRLWMVGSVAWAVYVPMSRIDHLFLEVSADDMFGDWWLPWWASLTSYVQPYADPTLGLHPNSHRVPH